MFELRCSLAVCSDGGPIVVPHAMLPRAERDHWFDREGHSRTHDGVVASVKVVEHLNVGVELLADPMADECPDDAELVLRRSSLDGFTDVT